MTYQFKSRSSSPHEQCEKEMALLREYNLALQKQNQSRNQERKALQDEIQRLMRYEKEWKEKGTVTKSVLVINSESKEYISLKEQYTQLKTRYENLLIQNSSLTSKIITQDNASTRIISFDAQRNKLNETIRKHENKIATLQGKLLACQRELNEARNKQENTSTTVTRQYQQSIVTIEELERQLRMKNEQVSRLQNEAIIKEEQTKALQRSVDGYALKIDALSDQLARIQRTHKIETVRIVQSQDPFLRSRIDQLSSLNAALTADNINLHAQTEYMRELQRRAALLEEANQKLLNELRMSLEARDSASRIQLQEDRNLKEAVYTLKAELQQVRKFNQLVRQENEQLYAQLQILKKARHNHSRCPKCRHKHNKSRSRSPVPQEQRPRAAFGETFSVFQSKLPISNHASHSAVSASHSHAQFSTIQEGRSRPTTNSKANERYNDLQRKIQMLQSQNQTLKLKLVHQI